MTNYRKIQTVDVSSVERRLLLTVPAVVTLLAVVGIGIAISITERTTFDGLCVSSYVAWIPFAAISMVLSLSALRQNGPHRFIFPAVFGISYSVLVVGLNLAAILNLDGNTSTKDLCLFALMLLGLLLVVCWDIVSIRRCVVETRKPTKI